MDAGEEYPGLDRTIAASDLSGEPEGRKKGGLGDEGLAGAREIGINGRARSRT